MEIKNILDGKKSRKKSFRNIFPLSYRIGIGKSCIWFIYCFFRGFGVQTRPHSAYKVKIKVQKKAKKGQHWMAKIFFHLFSSIFPYCSSSCNFCSAYCFSSQITIPLLIFYIWVLSTVCKCIQLSQWHQCICIYIDRFLTEAS